MGEAGLKIDQQVDVRAEQGCVIIEPVAAPEFALDQLLAAITPDSLHKEESFGPAVGRESLSRKTTTTRVIPDRPKA
jgi:antitoxin MazE